MADFFNLTPTPEGLKREAEENAAAEAAAAKKPSFFDRLAEAYTSSASPMAPAPIKAEERKAERDASALAEDKAKLAAIAPAAPPPLPQVQARPAPIPPRPAMPLRSSSRAPVIKMEPMDVVASAPAPAEAPEDDAPPIKTAPQLLPGTEPAKPSTPEQDYQAAAARVAANQQPARIRSALMGLFGGSAEKQNAIREEANQPLAQFMQKRDFLRQAQADQAAQARAAREAALDDPNSAVSKRAAMVALSSGLITPEQASGLTASEFSIVKDGASLSEARKQRADQLQLQHDELASREKEAAANRGNAVYLKRLDMEGDRERALLAAGAKANKQGDIPAAEVVKLKNIESGLQALDTYADAYKSASGLGPSGGKLMDLRKNLAPEIAEAEAPGARVNPALIERAENELPDRFTRNSRGKAALEAKRAALTRQYKTIVEGLQQQGFNTRAFNPERYVTPPSATANGVSMIAPDGSVRVVPQDQVQAALAAGGKLVGGA